MVNLEGIELEDLGNGTVRLRSWPRELGWRGHATARLQELLPMCVAVDEARGAEVSCQGERFVLHYPDEQPEPATARRCGTCRHMRGGHCHHLSQVEKVAVEPDWGGWCVLWEVENAAAPNPEADPLTATGDALDNWAQVYRLKRRPGEPDAKLRERLQGRQVECRGLDIGVDPATPGTDKTVVFGTPNPDMPPGSPYRCKCIAKPLEELSDVARSSGVLHVETSFKLSGEVHAVKVGGTVLGDPCPKCDGEWTLLRDLCPKCGMTRKPEPAPVVPFAIFDLERCKELDYAPASHDLDDRIAAARAEAAAEREPEPDVCDEGSAWEAWATPGWEGP